jgi:hypothetical protein
MTLLHTISIKFSLPPAKIEVYMCPATKPPYSYSNGYSICNKHGRDCIYLARNSADEDADD